MSGGSYDYAFGRIDDLAAEVQRQAIDRELIPEHRALRLAFADLLKRCAKAAHAIEWVDSCDYGPGDEVAAIRAALAPTPPDTAEEP